MWGVCVCIVLSLSPLHAFLQVSMPQHFSNTEKKKSNTIGKGEARISRWQLDSYVLLLSTVTEPSTGHSIKSPSGKAEKATDWTVGRKDVQNFISTSWSTVHL